MHYLVLVGALINLTGSSFYIRDTLRGDTKPNRVTWFLWAVAPFIATAAALSEGITWAALPVFMSGFVPFLIFLSSFVNKKSYWKLNKIDYYCGALSVLALVFWWITSQAIVAILFAVAADGLAAVPTLWKSWKFPETETGLAFVAGFLSASTSLFAVKNWSIEELAFPVYLMIVTTLLIFFIYRKRLFAQPLIK